METGKAVTSLRKPLPLANGITGLRMLGTLALAVTPLLSPGFYGVYTLTGVTDALDGWVARKTGTASEFGAKLDSWADLLFYAVMIGRLFPVLYRLLPEEIWWAVLGIVCLRLCAYAVAGIKYRTFASLHTWLNKLTGLAVFLIPYLLATPAAAGFCWGVCAVAGLASLEELAIHLCLPDYDSGRKSILRGTRRNRKGRLQ